MLNIKTTEEGEFATFIVRGDLREISADVLTVISRIFDAVKKQDEMSALLFKAMMTDNLYSAFEPPKETEDLVKEFEEKQKNGDFKGMEEFLAMMKKADGAGYEN